MRTVTSLLLLITAAVGCAAKEAPEVPPPEVAEADRQLLVAGGNAFGCDLYRQLAAGPGNVVCSPYSVSAALTMTAAGARGETAAQMAKVLGTAGLGDKVHPAQADLSYRLRHPGIEGGKAGPELLVANALWGQRGLAFKPAFLDLTRANYRAGLQQVDFAADTAAARKTINAWVAGQTRDMIPELFADGVLTADTRLVLTNAVYFKDLWQHPFDAKRTADDKFQTAPGETVPVRMMKLNQELRCLDGDTLQVVRLPYQGGKQSMLVVVPKAVDGLAAVEKSLTAAQVTAWGQKLGTAEVVLDLPKFTAKSKFELGGTLAKLGMPLPFSDAADFSGLTDAEKLAIGVVVHEAVVEVDEAGTVAAAATGVGIRVTSMPVEPKVVKVRADRPFLFLLVDDASGAILFAGRVAKP